MLNRRREQDASDRDRQRYKNQLDVTGSEKGQLEKLRLQLTEQVMNGLTLLENGFSMDLSTHDIEVVELSIPNIQALFYDL